LATSNGEETVNENDIAAAVDAVLTDSLSTQAKVGVVSAQSTDPDEYANALRVARKTGVPVETVLGQPKEMKRQAEIGAVDFDSLAKVSPTTAALLADIEKAKIAHDDVETLSGIERSLLGGIIEPVRRGLAQGRRGLTLLLDQMGVFKGLERRQAAAAAAHGIDYDPSVELAVRLAQQQREIERYPVPENIARGMQDISGAKTMGEALTEVIANPRAVLETTLQSLGASVPSLVGAASGSVFSPFGTALGAALGSYAVEYGSTLQDVMGEKGVDGTDAQAILAALNDQAFMEAAREKALKRGIPIAVFDALTAGLAGRLLARAKPTATSVGGRVAGELGIQAAGGAAGEAGAQLATGEYKPGDILMEAVAEIPTAIVEVPGNYQRALENAQRAQKDAELIENLNKLAAASKVLQRDPETFEQFIAKAAEDGPVQQVYIDANALMQSGVAEQVAAVSPSVAEQLTEAVQTGGQIAIPVEEYTARIAPTEYAQSLLDHLKTDPEGFSRAEAKAYLQGPAAQELRAEFERAIAEKQGDETFKQSAERVREQIKAQLDATGRFTPSVNDAYASLIGNYFAVAAARLGTTPEELFQRYPLKVAAQSVSAPEFVLDQGEVPKTDRTDPITGLPLNADGTVTVYHHTSREAAERIRKEGMLRSAAEPDLYFTTTKDTTTGYGEVAIPVRVRPELLILDDEFADGRADYRVEAPKRFRALRFLDDGSAVLYQSKSFVETEQKYGGREAHEKARAEGKTKLTYGQWVQVRTPEFKAWFGDWENDPANASKVVDPDTGEPMVVYHGTATPSFSEFKKTGLRDAGFIGKGFYFTASPQWAGYFAEAPAGRRARSAPAIYPVFLSLKNPLNPATVSGDEWRRMVDLSRAERNLPPISDEQWKSTYEYIEEEKKTKNALAMTNVYSTVLGDISALARRAGYDGIVAPDVEGDTYLAFDAAQIKSAIGNVGTFDPDNPNILRQGGGGARGMFDPSSLTVTLLKNADLSTFLHEAGHFFLELHFDLAARIKKEAEIFGEAGLAPGSRQWLEDTDAILRWFGLKSLEEWYALNFEEKRSYHERFARGFEAYLFEGKAPSIELQSLFQRFRAWLLHVYRSLKALNVELTDEVRGVFDRMLATNEQIQLAEQGRSMMPLFASPDQAGMTPEEFAAYQALGVEATAAAIEELQTRSLRDMRWLHNARSRAIKRLQREAKEKRAEVRIGIRREVMSRPIYQAWQFLTGKLSSEDKIGPREQRTRSPNAVDEAKDSLFTAIAKLGGLDREAVQAEWGLDPKERIPMPVFGKHVLRREGGKSINAMAELLAKYGYLTLDEYGKWDLHEFEEKFFAELRGDTQYSASYDYTTASERAGDQVVNPQALGAGRLDINSLLAMDLPTEVVDTLKARRMTAAKGGLHPDTVAELFGFSSGDELARALAAAEPPKEAIEALTDVRMLERYGDLASPEAIEKAADKAVHNDIRARFVATEVNALLKAIGKPKVLIQAAKAYAAETIARLKVRAISPGRFAAAEVKAAKASLEAFKAGNVNLAAAEKRNQLINLYAARAAHEALAEVEKGLRYLKKFDGDIKGIDADYLNQIRALLVKYDLRKQSPADIDKTTSLRAWVMARLAEGEVPEIAETLLSPEDRQRYIAETTMVNEDGEYIYADEAERAKLLADYIDRSAKTSYKNMTLEQFRGLVDTVRQIEHLGRLKNRLLTAKTEKALDEVKEEIAESIRSNARTSGKARPTRADIASRVAKALRRFGADHIRMGIRALVMDGGKDGGPMWRYFVMPANEAEEVQVAMRAEATEKLNAILKPVLKNVPASDRVGKGRAYPALGTSLNWEARFSILLNLGNEGNTQRLLSGGVGGYRGLSLEDVVRALDGSFTKAELEAAQQIWDLLDSYRPKIAELERETKGKEPEWVQPRPISIRSKDGEVVTLRGGYYPIVYDPALNTRAAELEELQELDMAKAAVRANATTRQTFTKQRLQEVKGRPLLLTLDSLYSGLDMVIHDLAFRRYAIDAGRLLRSKRIQDAIREHYGDEELRQVRRWVSDIIIGSQRVADGFEAASAFIRKNVTLAGLGLNVTSWLQQPFGIANTVTRLGGGLEGAKWVWRGLLYFAANPKRAVQEMMEASAFMRNRARTRFRELNEIRNAVRVEGLRERMAPWMMWGIIRTQLIADTISWRAGYEKAFADNPAIAEEEARAIADQVVRDSQGGGEIVDLSAIERGGAMAKLFTTFFNFQNTGTNLAYLSIKTGRSAGVRLMDMVMVFTVPVLVNMLTKELIVPGDSGDDDEEKLKKFLAEQISYPLGGIAFVREVVPAVEAMAGQGFGYQGPAGLRLFGDTYKFTVQAAQGELDDAFRKAAINLSGSLFGLPAAQINRTVTGIQALSEGETENPAAVVFGFRERR
jgi:hypothetical protein